MYAYFVEQYSFVDESLTCRFSLYQFETRLLAQESLDFYLSKALQVKDLQILDYGVLYFDKGVNE